MTAPIPSRHHDLPGPCPRALELAIVAEWLKTLARMEGQIDQYVGRRSDVSHLEDAANKIGEALGPISQAIAALKAEMNRIQDGD